MRALILIHRYLGIAIGLVMAMWCVSGFVMMYVGFPELDNARRLHALEPMDWRDCCAYDAISTTLGFDVVDDFSIEMAAGRPIVRVLMAAGGSTAFDLRSGEKIKAISAPDALTIANRFASANHIDARAEYDASIERDQWTVQGQFNDYRPLHRIKLHDARDTVLYVSSTSGEIVQHTDASQRFWNWLGAVPHWLYPTMLKQHAAVWSQGVIWLSMAGAFLTAIGLYIGIVQWRASSKRWTPYRGVKMWHHLTGLIFGVLLLTWVGSGWVSMNPWGLFAGPSFKAERDRVRDVWMDGRLLTTTLRALASYSGAKPNTRIESAPLHGKLFLLVYSGADVQRLDAQTLEPTPLQLEALRAATQSLTRENQQSQLELLNEGDDYYYSGHEARTLPVYRLLLNDAERTRLYFDVHSGDIVTKVGPRDRWYRWAFEGLHRWDFNAAIRTRPWWDVLVLTLLLGVTTIALTGVYMGYRFLRR